MVLEWVGSSIGHTCQVLSRIRWVTAGQLPPSGSPTILICDMGIVALLTISSLVAHRAGKGALRGIDQLLAPQLIYSRAGS